MNYLQLPYGRFEDVPDGFIVATYIASGLCYENLLHKTGLFAVGQSVGTWIPVPGISKSMVTSYQARVVSVLPVEGPGDELSVILRVAFPAANFGGSMTMLMTSMLGNDVSTALQVRLTDLQFSPASLHAFSHPKRNIEDLRELTGVRQKRPLVLNMIKPCTGFSPEEGAELFLQSALGGVDLIKDDELLGTTTYNSLAKRTQLYLKAANRAYETTGKHTVYLPNISGTPSQVMDNAKAILDCGAKGCLINYIFGGMDSLRELSDRYGDDLFILGHYAGISVFDGLRTGMENKVSIGLVPRICGASGVMTMFPDFSNAKMVTDFFLTVQAQRLPIPGLAPTTTVVGGGITPINQKLVQDHIGPDCVIGIGGAIQGHPFGTTAGAKAAMAAVQATSQGIDLEVAAKDDPNLAKAFEVWG